jgi:hypothetical protein
MLDASQTYCRLWCCFCLLLLLQAEIGVDAGAYARLLMVHAKEAADAAADAVAAGTLSAQAILESAFYRTNVQGVCACVIGLQDGQPLLLLLVVSRRSHRCLVDQRVWAAST